MIGNKIQIQQALNNIKDDKKLYKFEEYKEKRSNKANKYFWELLGQLCLEMGLDTIEEYKKRVRQLGVFRYWEIEKDNLKTFNKMWTEKGIAWFIDIVDIANENKIGINAYYGSSSYNTKQMSRLIDGVVQDCQAIGIETKTPNEIKSLLGGN